MNTHILSQIPILPAFQMLQLLLVVFVRMDRQNDRPTDGRTDLTDQWMDVWMTTTGQTITATAAPAPASMFTEQQCPHYQLRSLCDSMVLCEGGQPRQVKPSVLSCSHWTLALYFWATQNTNSVNSSTDAEHSIRPSIHPSMHLFISLDIYGQQPFTMGHTHTHTYQI